MRKFLKQISSHPDEYHLMNQIEYQIQIIIISHVNIISMICGNIISKLKVSSHESREKLLKQNNQPK